MTRANALLALLFAGCAGTARSCAACNAQSFGADWVVVQMGYDGAPYRCWELHETSVASGEGGGVHWLSPEGNLVVIDGHYNLVQVTGGQWAEAFADLGLTRETCRALHDRVAEAP